MFPGSFKDVLRKFQECFKKISRMFKESFKCVSRKFDKKCPGSFKKVLMKFCFAILLLHGSHLPEQNDGLFLYHLKAYLNGFILSRNAN